MFLGTLLIVFCVSNWLLPTVGMSSTQISKPNRSNEKFRQPQVDKMVVVLASLGERRARAIMEQVCLATGGAGILTTMVMILARA